MNLQDVIKWLAEHGNELTEEDRGRIRQTLADTSPFAEHPVSTVRWVPKDKLQANDYNPNVVATKEMQLLKLSILKDGYTQPIVTFHDTEQDRYVIVDGFHRFVIGSRDEEVIQKTKQHLPIVVINKSLADRMASTVRHNRARGVHHVTGTGVLVMKLMEQGKSDDEIAIELGMTKQELDRLKHVTGVAVLFKDHSYSRAWVDRRALIANADKES